MSTFVFEKEGKFGLSTEYPEYESCSPNYFEDYEVFSYELLPPEYDFILRADFDMFIVHQGEKQGLVRALCHFAQWFIEPSPVRIEYPGGRFFLVTEKAGQRLLHFNGNMLNICEPDGPEGEAVKGSARWFRRYWKDENSKGLWALEDRENPGLDCTRLYLTIKDDPVSSCLIGEGADGISWMIYIINERVVRRRMLKRRVES